MAALDDVVVHYLAHPPLLALAVGAVEIVDHGAEYGHVGHLAGNEARFHRGASEVIHQFFLQQLFDFPDELRPLVVEHFGLIERLDLLVLRIAAYRIHDRKQLGHRRNRHFRGDQVDAFLLTPARIGQGAVEQLIDFLFGSQFRSSVLLPGLMVNDRARVRRSFATEEPGHDGRGRLAAANFDLDFIAFP